MSTIRKVEEAAELRKLREERGLSQAEVARRSGLAESTIYLVEKGAASDGSVQRVRAALEQRDFLGVPMRSPDAVVKALALPRPSPEESARVIADLQAMAIDLGTFSKVAGAQDGVSRAVKGGSLEAARTELEAAEGAAAAAVASAKSVGGQLARALQVNPNIAEPSRAALNELFEECCAKARAACVAVAKACHTIMATATDRSEVEVAGAKAASAIEAIAHLRDVNG